jgi:two-component system response regulator FixJ
MNAPVFIADDDVGIRDSLTILLEANGLTVESFADGHAFLTACMQRRPGCAVLDVAMPGMSGYQVQAALNQRNLTIPVIFLTGHGDVPMAVQAIKAGAMDFLEKPVTGTALLKRVRRALALDAQNRVVEEDTLLVRQRYASMSPREKEVMALVVAGLSSKEIARHLGVSARTVDTHRAHIMLKMQATNVAELVQSARLCKD